MYGRPSRPDPVAVSSREDDAPEIHACDHDMKAKSDRYKSCIYILSCHHGFVYYFQLSSKPESLREWSNLLIERIPLFTGGELTIH